jgi:hypothetical protein
MVDFEHERLINTAWKSDAEIPQTVVRSHFGCHFDESDR